MLGSPGFSGGKCYWIFAALESCSYKAFKNRKKQFGFAKRIVLHNIFSILPGAVNFIFYFSLYLKGFEYLDANLLGIAAAYVVRYILSSSIVWGEKKSKAKYTDNE